MIKIMSPQLSNLIAAGEVVEKPSNVIKELIENSLDACATQIELHISEDGISSITVKDNGIGMSLEDARLACTRHATSKVYSEEDLLHIQTLGFRGEALAAIASVSVVEIITKQDQNDGYYLKFVQGLCVEEKPYPTNTGTQVKVSELFYQTPARFKFLSSEFQHQKQQRQLFYELALSRVDVSFSLFEGSTKVKSTRGSNDVKITFSELFGAHYFQHMDVIETSIQHTTIRLFVVSPEMHTHSKHLMFSYINHRFVKYYSLLDSIQQAYKPYLMTQKYPIALVYVDIDPSRVDVNRHPQKLQVKVSNESILSYHIEKTIEAHFKKEKRMIPKPFEHIIKEETYVQTNLDLDTWMLSEETPHSESIKGIPTLTFIGLLSGTYALFQGEQGLYVMDVHAAAERVRYHYYHKLFVDNLKHIRQRMIPYTIAVDPNTYASYLSLKDVFQSYGFELTVEGIISHPVLIKEEDFEFALGSIYESHVNHKSYDLIQLKEDLAKDISCKGAVKANHYSSKEEIETLLSSLRHVDNPYQCPHGRPTLVNLSYYDIEKMFKRVVS